MPYRARAASAAKDLLSRASRQLSTTDPTRYPSVSSALDRSLDWMVDEPAMAPTIERPFEPSFSEPSSGSLAFQVRPSGPGVSADDRREIATEAMRRIVAEQFGNDALHFFDQRTEPARARYGAAQGFGTLYALGLDQHGLNEATAAYEWGPHIADAMPDGVMQLARTAVSHMRGLRPIYTTVRCGRRSGGQQITFEIDRETSLQDLKPMMTALGLGERHGGLVTLTAFVLGARFSLPASVATVTLLNTRRGPEMRLDVNIDALPDTPEQLLPLLRLPMTERPRNLSALDRWMTAMTPDGYFGPGMVTVLSVRVRADMPARLALYLRPVALDPTAAAAEPAAA